MSNFKGKNNVKSSSQIIFERAKYKKYMIDNRDASSKDYNFAEFSQYGRIDHQMNVVYNTGFDLKRVKTPDGSKNVMAIDFVADAYNAIYDKFNQALQTNHIPNNQQYLSQLNAVKGYEDPKNLYDAYIQRLLEKYNSIYLKDVKINNFDDYYKNFENFARKMNTHYPMTFTGFQRSKHSSIFSSGLAISIADIPFDDDELKEKFFIDSPTFEFYRNVCVNNGMTISENAPHLLVADLISPALRPYTDDYYLSNKKTIFSKYFEKCDPLDIDLLINNLLIYYSTYFNNNIYYNNFYFCKNNIKNNKKFLKPIIMTEIQKKYTDNYLINLYVTLRNIEEYHYYSDKQIKEIIRKAKNLEKKLDISEAISYIRKEFRKTYKFRHGNLNYQVKRAQQRGTNDISNY